MNEIRSATYLRPEWVERCVNINTYILYRQPVLYQLIQLFTYPQSYKDT
jgi:hypothetical protein